jgi:hypothetical protein
MVVVVLSSDVRSQALGLRSSASRAPNTQIPRHPRPKTYDPGPETRDLLVSWPDRIVMQLSQTDAQVVMECFGHANSEAEAKNALRQSERVQIAIASEQRA